MINWIMFWVFSAFRYKNFKKQLQMDLISSEILITETLGQNLNVSKD